MAVTQVMYRVDTENNAETWWVAFREAISSVEESDPELHGTCWDLLRHDEVTMHDPRLIEAFDTFVTSLPGWEDGPTHAPTALTAHAE